ncbi:MAG: recombinase family protein, partial [Clostridia bacterium]|nr:recombinase family protein [Clostridia bacterium]
KHNYYKCGGAKRHLGCKRKAIKKDWIEKVVVLQTVARVLKDEEIERIADALLKMQEQEDTTIPAMQAQLKECEKAIENMLNAIQSGILTESTKGRLEQLEEQQRNLKTAILRAEIRRPKYSKERIVNWISRFKGGNPNNRNYQRQIIDTFVNSVYIYDDKLVFTYNFKDGTETITLEEIEAAFGSDLNQSAPPN